MDSTPPTHSLNANPYSSDADAFVGAGAALPPLPPGGDTATAEVEGTPASPPPLDPVPSPPQHQRPVAGPFTDLQSSIAPAPAPSVVPPPAPAATPPVSGDDEYGQYNDYEPPLVAAPGQPAGAIANLEASPAIDATLVGPGGVGSSSFHTISSVGAQSLPAVPDAAGERAASPRRGQRTSKCWRLAFYQQHFEVETRDVVHRVAAAFTPWRPPSYLRDQRVGYGSVGAGGPPQPPPAPPPAAGALSAAPDLYGPLWVTSTLWIAIAVFGHIASKLAWHGDAVLTPIDPDDGANASLPALRHIAGRWDYSFAWALVGAAVIYGYTYGAPLLLYCAMRCKRAAPPPDAGARAAPVDFPRLLCLYSYSNMPFIAAAALCVTPIGLLQWVFVCAAGLLSGAGIVLNLWGAWRRDLPAEWFAGVVGVVFILHLSLSLFLKLFCFNWTGSDPGEV